MKKIGLIISVAILVILTSCTKEPVAGFEFINSGSTFEIGEKIFIINNSSDAKNYSWSFGDGSTSSLQDPDHVYSSSGTYSIKLTAINKSKEDTYSKSVTVKSTKGEIVFCSDFSGPPINVYFSSSYSGQITAVETGFPECGQTGCVTVSDLAPGTYNFYADETSSPNRHWSGSVDIEADKCSKMNLTASKSGEVTFKKIEYGDDSKFESNIIGNKTK